MDPLKYWFVKPVLSGRLVQSHLLLSKFDITYITQKSINEQTIADLAENSVEVDKPLADFFFDESILSIETEEEYPGG